MWCCCCSRTLFLGCTLAPLSLVVLLLALLIPQLTPKHSCQVDAAGACKAVEGTSPAKCEDGVFLQLTQQPRLGLRHVVPASDSAFARLKSATCTVDYLMGCADGAVQLREKWSCAGKESKASTALGKQWEVCAKGAQLQLLKPVIDLAFDIETDADAEVLGCVTVSAPAALPELGSVRGSTTQQTQALVTRKAKVGGCPTWHSDEDRLDRSWDFRPTNGLPFVLAVQQYMKLNKRLAREAKAGQVLKQTTLPMVGTTMLIGIAGQGMGGMMKFGSTVNCGSPAYVLLPSPGISVTRHADTSALVANPTQRRGKLIGGGYSEVCFQGSLPIFLSTGSPEHTQARKLWDAAGLATMHEGEIPEPEVPKPSAVISARRALLSVVGLKTPLMDELAPVVARLFLRKLWGRVPTAEQADAIAQYASVGGACIMGHFAEKLPILPGKIKAARSAALAFAKGSPVGETLVKKIKGPEFKELRELYMRSEGNVEDSALQNLADASLFAGLIGTSTMSMNCLLQLVKGPQYVRMFRENSTAFLMEVMRTLTAVGGSTQMLQKPWKVTIAGEDIELPEGAYVTALTGMTAGLDASVFPNPWRFDSGRPNLGEGQNWNGLNKYVFTRNYTGAPRFCPGALVSVKIAAKVCGLFSAEWKSE